ncbi:hypothetical protein [Paracoccus sp. 228]|uniref:hypothetical protein n=1 Tax=Paracoccus sp. 228 TaxID=1192054 RepID=UPI0005DFDDE5|nr:hypothetical protein [Paracoccus sp. 228]KIX19151.1 hypothetical protein SY26_03335 [Paracoccus sp. 228]
MALKTVLDNLDDVPEALHAEYKEIDGKFVLDLDGIDVHPTVVNLKTAHERQKQTNRTLQSDLTAARTRLEGLPDDFDADAYEALQAQAEGKAPAKTDEQVAQLRQQLERQKQTELAKKDERITTLLGAVQQSVLHGGLSKALDEIGVDPSLKPGAMALLMSKGALKLVEEDGQFKAQVDTDMGPMPVKNYVSDWSGSEEGKVYVKKATSGDALGGTGARFTDNPWDSSNGKKPNLTKQQQAISENPTKARQMAQAAGVTPNW